MPQWLDDILEGATKYSPLIKTGVAALSTYASFKDQQKKNQLQKDAYDDYMAQADAAGHAARAAIDINYTPMTVSGVPQTKADVTDFTAVAAKGGLMSIPNKQRKRYARGPQEFEVQEMDEEVFSPGDFKMETGVDVLGEQVFYDTGQGDRANATQIWGQMQDPDKAIFDFDFEIFFMDGGWRDMIKSQVDVQEDVQLASDPGMGEGPFMMEEFLQAVKDGFKGSYDEYIDQIDRSPADYGQAPGAQGIMQAAKGGRIGYNRGLVVRPGGYQGDFGSYKDYLEQLPDNDKLLELYAAGDIAAVIKELKKRGYDTEDRAKGGRIGLNMGANDPKNMPTEWLIEIVKDGRSTPEILIELEKRIPGAIEQIKLEEGQGDQAFSINEEILSKYDPDKRAVEEDFLYDLRENINPNYREPMEHLPLMAKGGRIGYDIGGMSGSDLITQLIEKYLAEGLSHDQARKKAMKEIMGKAKGGRIKKAPGGIMDLGGLEKDYRTTGGFVPLGGRERADDVPARLSKNEFVMTADAVRAAGGGSINRGAQRMYDTMKNLEASPQSRRMTA